MKEHGVTSACAVTAMLAHVPSRQRIEGFQSEIPRTQIVLTSHSVRSAEGLIRPLLQNNQPEAIFAVNGWIAPVIYRVAAELGIRIPDDMVVAAFDDFDPDYSERVGLTSVQQHVPQLAQHAVALLIDRVEGRAPPGKKVVLESALVPRGSCAELAFTPIQGGAPAL
jgi:LacI family transcriptional regulator